MKSSVLYALFGALEPSYATVTAPTAAGYVLPTEPPTMTTDYANDGKRGPDARSGATLANVRQSGRSVSGSVKVHARGNSLAYDATTTPLDSHLLLRIAGHSATFVAASGSGSNAVPAAWVYAPVTASASTPPASATLKLYSLDEIVLARGVLVESVKITAEANGIVTQEFGFKGLADLPIDNNGSAPDVSGYDVTTPPIKFDGLAPSGAIGDWADAQIVSWNLDASRELTALPAGNVAGGHAGFYPGRRTVKGQIKVRAAALSAFNPYVAAEQATLLQLQLVAGSSVAGDRLAIESSACQITKATREADGAVVNWTLDYELSGGPTGNGDYAIRYSYIPNQVTF